MKTILISFLAVSAMVMTSCNKSNNDNTDTGSSSLNASDSLFAVKASQGNIGEIEAAQVSLTNSQNDSVKMFGQMMINDHTKAQTTLDSIGRVLNFSMPTTPNAEDQALKMKLMNLHGQAFDSTYVNAQVADHQTVLALLDNERNNGTNAMLKAYAAKNYPIVQMHLMMADSLQVKLNQ